MTVMEAAHATRAAAADPVRRALVTALREVDGDVFTHPAIETGMVLDLVERVVASGSGALDAPDVREASIRLGWRLGRRRVPLMVVHALVAAIAAVLDGPAGHPAGAEAVRRGVDVVMHAYGDGLDHQPTAPERRAARCRSLLDGRPRSTDEGHAESADWYVAVVTLPAARQQLHDLALRLTAALPDLLVTDGPGHLAALAHGDRATGLLAADLRGRLDELPDPWRITLVGAGPVCAVPRAYARCRRLDLLATHAGDTRPVVTPADLALETVLDSERGAPLARLLGHLPETLVQTVRELYRHDLDRRATSRALHVHRNTLDYRLGRVTALTGVSPTSVRGIQLFSSALTARWIRDEKDADAT